MSFLFLGLACFVVSMYLLRLKNTSVNEKPLEEWLYQKQLDRIHDHSSNKEYLTDAIKEMQRDRKTFIAELEHGLKNNQFILHYQPIVNALHGKMMMVEALIRWQHPIHGLLQPTIFLPLCENTGFIIPLGEWVLKTACQQIKQWKEMGLNQLGISINFSIEQLINPTLLSFISDRLSENDLSSDSLHLEISENFLMKGVRDNVSILQDMSKMGLKISLGDFGTGNFSLQYIKQFPVNNLKIDKMFINDMLTNITSFGIVKSIVSLAKSLGITVTAQGVENEHQCQVLKKMGCDYLQGYLFGKPAPSDEFTQLFYADKNSYLKNTRRFIESDNHYLYDVLKKDHYHQVVELISHFFCEENPMAKYLGITTEEFFPFAKKITSKAIKDGLSMVALNHDKVCACTIVEDIAHPFFIRNDIDSKFKFVLLLLENLGNEFFNERAMYKGHIARLLMTAVDKDHDNQNVFKKIQFESMRLAKENYFDFMCCEVIENSHEKNTVNQLTNNRLLIHSQKYKDFVVNGIKPFEQLEGFASAYIWELRDNAKLRYKINT